LNYRIQPFSTLSLWRMENYALLATLITVYVGLYYTHEIPDGLKQEEQYYKLSNQMIGLNFAEAWKWIFFAVILIVNLSFVIYWGFKAYEEVRLTLLQQYNKLYSLLCFWQDGRKDLDEAKKKTDDEDRRDQLNHEFVRAFDSVHKYLNTSKPKDAIQVIDKFKARVIKYTLKQRQESVKLELVDKSGNKSKRNKESSKSCGVICDSNRKESDDLECYDMAQINLAGNIAHALTTLPMKTLKDVTNSERNKTRPTYDKRRTSSTVAVFLSDICVISEEKSNAKDDQGDADEQKSPYKRGPSKFNDDNDENETPKR